MSDDVAALSDAPLALFLDVDGTLLDLAARPDEVVTPAGLVTTLARAERKLAGALALISGRSIDELDRLFAPLRLRASGVHGAEIRFDPGGADDAGGGEPTCPSRCWTRSETRGRAVSRACSLKTSASASPFTIASRRLRNGRLREIVKQLVDSIPIAVDVMDAHYAIEIKSPWFRQRRRDRGVSLHPDVSRADADLRRRRYDR